ncbi:MAG: SxtJ family membrane protein [bacterium]
MLLEEIKNIQSTKKALRSFGILLSIFLSILASISLWKGGMLYRYLFPGAVVVMAAALYYPKVLKFVYFPWMTVATIIGWTVTHLILTLFYYFVMTPFGLCARLFGKDLLDEKIAPERESYWILRDKQAFRKEDLRRQF